MVAAPKAIGVLTLDKTRVTTRASTMDNLVVTEHMGDMDEASRGVPKEGISIQDLGSVAL
jgi:hypothetical protein